MLVIMINGFYNVFYVKFSLGHFDPSGHQTNFKILKTPQAPPGEQIYFFMILSVCMVLQAKSRNFIQFSQEIIIIIIKLLD